MGTQSALAHLSVADFLNLAQPLATSNAPHDNMSRLGFGDIEPTPCYEYAPPPPQKRQKVDLSLGGGGDVRNVGQSATSGFGLDPGFATQGFGLPAGYSQYGSSHVAAQAMLPRNHNEKKFDDAAWVSASSGYDKTQYGSMLNLGAFGSAMYHHQRASAMEHFAGTQHHDTLHGQLTDGSTHIDVGLAPATTAAADALANHLGQPFPCVSAANAMGGNDAAAVAAAAHESQQLLSAAAHESQQLLSAAVAAVSATVHATNPAVASSEPVSSPHHSRVSSPSSSASGKSKKVEGKWGVRLSELREYKSKYGDCLVPDGYRPNPKLARWVREQRGQYKLLQEGKPSHMTTERIEALTELGFVWSLRGKVDWMDRFQELVEYKCTHGDCLVPTNYLPNTQLGTWVANQRKHYRLMKEGKASMMTQDRINLLERLGFAWSIRPSSQRRGGASRKK